MLARLILLVSALLALLGAGCSAANDKGSPSEQPGPQGPHLENLGDDTLELLPGGMEMLKVRYLDGAGEPVAGQQVEFSFLGLSSSAFLPSERPVTDGDGIASTTLSIGSNPPSEFSVRVSAQGVDPLLIEVHVVDARIVYLTVEVSYYGERDVKSRSVTKIAAKSCEEALAAGVAGDVTLSYDDVKHRPVFELAPGVHYAILAWGRDRTNAKVAVGCTEFVAPVTPVTPKPQDPPPSADCSVELVDTATSRSYELVLDLDVSASVERLEQAIRARADQDFPSSEGSTAQGAFFVQALEAELLAGGVDPSGKVPADYDLTLENALDAAGSGPGPYAHALADDVRAFGSHMKLHADYGIGGNVDVPMSIAVDMVYARNESDTVTLLLNGKDGSYVPPLASIEAVYSDSWGALDVQALSLSQGLGDYGKAVMGALLEYEAQSFAGYIGCAVVEQRVASDVPACDEECRAAMCERALNSLRMSLTMDLAAFDVSHPSLGLRGKLYAHDRTDDGIVDDLGPADLSGNWGTAEESDSVSGRVLEPSVAIP